MTDFASGDLLPDDDLDLTDEEAFALADAEPASIEDFLGLGPGDDPDLLITDEPSRRIGRSWAYDVDARGFIGYRAPLTTTGITTLRYWIVKCLATERDSLAIHPPGYGVEDLNAAIGTVVSTGVGAELEERTRNALLFHPSITDVTDFVHYVGDGEDDESLFVSFTVVTNQGDEFAFDTLRVG
jgi:hypothetical protein